MRITHSLLLDHQQQSLNRIYAQLFKVQQQLGTGRRLLKPSDDPAATQSALGVRSARSRLDQVRTNIGMARSELDPTDAILQDISEVVSRARELAISGLNESSNDSDRRGMGAEVDALLTQLLGLGNSRGPSGYRFSGSARDRAAFERVATEDGDRVFYRGDDRSTRVDLGRDLQLSVNLPGSQVFGTGTREATRYSGSTGAAAGTGSDSILGSDRLLLRHTQTLLGGSGTGQDPASGLKVGPSSAVGDTLLGPGHTLALVDTSGTGAAGTVSIDGGPTLNWTAADGDLEVTTAEGDVLYLDFTSIGAGFSGDVDVDSAGMFSLDGAKSEVAIDFTNANQVVVDSETGESIFVDATGVVRTGSEQLSAAGTYDLFAAMILLRDRLLDEGDTGDVREGIQDALDALTQGQERVLSALSIVGTRVRMLELSASRTEQLDVLLAENQSRLEDTDISQAAMELARTETMLQAALLVSTRIQNLPSLLSFL